MHLGDTLQQVSWRWFISRLKGLSPNSAFAGFLYTKTDKHKGQEVVNWISDPDEAEKYVSRVIGL